MNILQKLAAFSRNHPACRQLGRWARRTRQKLAAFPRRHSQSESAGAKIDYARRSAMEKRFYDDCLNVHELPPIFHYWSKTHLAPHKLHPFGIADPEQFFLLYAEKLQRRHPAKELLMISLGSGNCDMEARLAKRMAESGITRFRLECLDLNEKMLERGRQHALEHGASDYLRPVLGDFNHWEPDRDYDVVIANQCLHHVAELEHLFGAIHGCLKPDGYFLASDMIGRNGHQRWPEALKLVQMFWEELPPSYRYNHLLKRREPEYINFDCAADGFEGIRAQDILPLLIERFHFELFIPFANIVTVFIDRAFGHNFNAQGEWDRDFIDRVHARDDEAILAGEISPTQMLAVLKTSEIETALLHPKLTPTFCVRRP